MMTENKDVLKEILGRIPRHIRWCLCTGLLSGILIHAYMFTNKLPNWDDINNVGGYGVGSEFGRWFLKYVHPLDGVWSAPWSCGLFAVMLISVAACMVLSALELRSMTSAVLVPLMMMSFPGMCSLFTFMFTADCYAVGILLACTGAWLIRRYRYGFLPGALLLVLSMGIYQAYFCLTLGILVCGLFLDLLSDVEQSRGVFRRGVKTCGILLVSILIYMLIARLIYPELEGYNGLSEMGRLEPSRLPRLILRAYKWVAEYFLLKPYSYVTPFSGFLNVLICLLIAGSVAGYFVKYRLWKSPAAALLYLFLAAAIPLSLGSIIIMAPDASVSLLMLYQYQLLYVFAAAMLERSLSSPGGLFESGGEKQGILSGRRAGWTAGILTAGALLLTGYQNFIVINQAYFRMGIAYERAYAWYNRIMERIETTEGYCPGDAFALVGEYGLSETPDLLGDYAMDGEMLEDLSGVARETGLLTSGVRHWFMKTYIGVKMPDLPDDIEDRIRASEVYRNMPAWPAEGCVERIENVWVVKTCEETLSAQTAETPEE